MPVPTLGKYVFKDERGEIQYAFSITEANPDIGEIKGKYQCLGSRVGGFESPLTDPSGNLERASTYAWISRAQGGVRINQAPFLIHVTGFGSRVVDGDFQQSQQSWTGVYSSGDPEDTIAMSGVECHVVFDSTGKPKVTAVFPLGERTFTLVK